MIRIPKVTMTMRELDIDEHLEQHAVATRDGKVTADVVAGHIYLVDAGLSRQATQTCAAQVCDTTSGPH